MRLDQVSLFGTQLDVATMPQAVAQIVDWLNHDSPHCRYVVTPNVDHVVMLQHHAELRAAYDDASLTLADGHPVVWASRLLGRRLPARVPGSELVPALFDAANPDQPLSVYLLGAGPGVAERAADRIHRDWPGVRVTGTYSPPFGFERDTDETNKILSQIADASPQVLVVGLGAPKQELWVHQHHKDIAAGVALCVGATIDFLAGEKARAPHWMQRSGLEWLHRMASEPKRLAGRYARDAWIFPQIVWREWRGKMAPS